MNPRSTRKSRKLKRKRRFSTHVKETKKGEDILKQDIIKPFITWFVNTTFNTKEKARHNFRQFVFYTLDKIPFFHYSREELSTQVCERVNDPDTIVKLLE